MSPCGADGDALQVVAMVNPIEPSSGDVGTTETANTTCDESNAAVGSTDSGTGETEPTVCDPVTAATEPAPNIQIASVDTVGTYDGTCTDDSVAKVTPDDSQSFQGQDGAQDPQRTLTASETPTTSTDDTNKTTDGDSENSSAETSSIDSQTPVVCYFGATNSPSEENGSDSAPLQTDAMATDTTTDSATSETSNADTATTETVTTDTSATDTPTTVPDTPVIYTMDPIDIPASVELHRRDVKRLAREIKRGHVVEIDAAALTQLHTRAKKHTRQLVERVIATTYAQCRPGCVVLPRTGYEQAIDEAYAALGAPTTMLKIHGRPYVAPVSG
jgi:hypothetical protein